VSDVEFESKDEACERFKEIFEDQPALVESVDCDELPASLRVKVPDHESGIAIQSALEGEPGVDRVIVPELPVNPLTESGISDAEVERLAPLAEAAADQPACQMDAFE
jgi:cell division protein FtsX